jgi:hypothetical protein
MGVPCRDSHKAKGIIAFTCGLLDCIGIAILSLEGRDGTLRVVGARELSIAANILKRMRPHVNFRSVRAQRLSGGPVCLEGMID